MKAMNNMDRIKWLQAKFYDSTDIRSEAMRSLYKWVSTGVFNEREFEEAMIAYRDACVEEERHELGC